MTPLEYNASDYAPIKWSRTRRERAIDVIAEELTARGWFLYECDIPPRRPGHSWGGVGTKGGAVVVVNRPEGGELPVPHMGNPRLCIWHVERAGERYILACGVGVWICDPQVEGPWLERKAAKALKMLCDRIDHGAEGKPYRAPGWEPSW